MSLSKYAFRKNSVLHSMLFLLVSRGSAFVPKRGTSCTGVQQWERGTIPPMRDLSVRSARLRMYSPVAGSGTAARAGEVLVGWGMISNRWAYSRYVGAWRTSVFQIGWKISRIWTTAYPRKGQQTSQMHLIQTAYHPVQHWETWKGWYYRQQGSQYHTVQGARGQRMAPH